MPYGTVNADLMGTSSGQTLGAGNATNFKNRIINGAMIIDQRNGGGSITPAASSYTLDRWAYYATQASKFTAQQSTTSTTGFSYSALLTSASAYSVTSGDVFVFYQPIEGYNVADLGLGTANAKTVTLSFWVRSSLTGTFGACVSNATNNRSYVFSYTINAANTWEQKSITIAGDTTGTWVGATNGVGLYLKFSLGAGSNFIGTANAWNAADVVSPSGCVNIVGTSGATWYVTGVQLEVGASASSFEVRDYTRELLLCQRYFVANCGFQNGFAYSSTTGIGSLNYPVTMRVNPTVGYTAGSSTISVDYIGGSTNVTVAVTAGGGYINKQGLALETNGLSGRTTWQGLIFNMGTMTLSAEL